MIIVIIRRLWHDKAFLLFSCYWLFAGSINLLDATYHASNETREIVNVLYNMIDVVFLLVILYVNTNDRVKRVFISISGALYLVTLFVAVYLKGLNYNAGKYPLGLGIVVVVIIVSWTIAEYLLNLRHTRRQRSLIFLYAALLFQFGTFVIIYIFDYFIPGSSQQDSFLLYYISSIIALLIAIFGLTRKGIERDLLKAEIIR